MFASVRALFCGKPDGFEPAGSVVGLVENSRSDGPVRQLRLEF